MSLPLHQVDAFTDWGGGMGVVCKAEDTRYGAAGTVEKEDPFMGIIYEYLSCLCP